MKVLTDITVPPLLDTSSGDIVKDFFDPVLAVSIRYDRGVGFFSPAWLSHAAQGMTLFAANGGRARWVASPVLGETDWKALQEGDEETQNETLKQAMETSIDALGKTVEADTLSALAWLVADGTLDFKLALPRNKLEHCEFHDKFGIFTDTQGNRVSFNSSYNDTVQGMRNHESIKIFCSWHPSLAMLVDSDAGRFERLWNNGDPNVQVYDVPADLLACIVRLRTHDRPYPEPERAQLSLLNGGPLTYKSVCPSMPTTFELRDYQDQAVDAWFAHDCRGLLEMATAAGKTMTALSASVRLYEREKRAAVIITVPYEHLVDQWDNESQRFGYQPILAYQNKSSWIDDLNCMVMDFSSGYRDCFCVITTHDTFLSEDFQAAIARLKGPSLVIAAEAHHLGAVGGSQGYPQQVPFRLALSAAPDRWFDDEGSAALRSYFGGTVFSFTLAQAIGVSLTPYNYHPHLVQLTTYELKSYQELSTKIARLAGRDDGNPQETLKLLLIRRAEILNRAVNKTEELSALIDASDSIEQTLFYCAPGQIDEVMRLLGWEKGLLVQRFIVEEDTRERRQLLADFASGDVQALAAVKCLDEGVDVPGTRTAYIMASSSDPREFIERRGRVLHTAPGKKFSVIHDLIAAPPAAWTSSQDPATFDIERGMMRRELERYKEFAASALNKRQAMDVIREIASRYDFMDL